MDRRVRFSTCSAQQLIPAPTHEMCIHLGFLRVRLAGSHSRRDGVHPPLHPDRPCVGLGLCAFRQRAANRVGALRGQAGGDRHHPECHLVIAKESGQGCLHRRHRAGSDTSQYFWLQQYYPPDRRRHPSRHRQMVLAASRDSIIHPPLYPLASIPGHQTPAQGFSLSTLFLTFLKIGSVLYGSGYVLLAFLRSEFVQGLGWLTDQQIIDAVAIGQVTPGPLSTAATFLGYVLGGVPGALLATLGMFLPSFLLVILTIPHPAHA